MLFSLCLHSINPVTGSYEAPRPNPLEHMTEEQKEYEAVKLVNMIDQLQRYYHDHTFKFRCGHLLKWFIFHGTQLRRGIIQPARVGEDGKPHAVEHVLELQKD